MNTTYHDIDRENLGIDATEDDVAEFVELCEQVKSLHPELTDSDITEAVFGDGDYYRNAKRLGAVIR